LLFGRLQIYWLNSNWIKKHDWHFYRTRPIYRLIDFKLSPYVWGLNIYHFQFERELDWWNSLRKNHCSVTSVNHLKKRNIKIKFEIQNKKKELSFQLNIFFDYTIIVHLYEMTHIISNELSVSFYFVVFYQKQSLTYTHTQFVRSFIVCAQIFFFH